MVGSHSVQPQTSLEEKNIRILYCFSGLPRPGDIKQCLIALAALTEFTIHITEIDIRRSSSHNLICSNLQFSIKEQIRNKQF